MSSSVHACLEKPAVAIIQLAFSLRAELGPMDLAEIRVTQPASKY